MKKPNFKPLGGAVIALLDPLLAKRTHVDASLALAWPELAGEKLAGRSQPLKVTWPKRGSPDDPFEPGVLTVACEGAAALDLQYQTGELVSRINSFFGYTAIGRIRIEQRAIAAFRPKDKRQPQTVTPGEAASLLATVRLIEDDDLRASLLRLGESVTAENRHK
jgi:hypothetical protein